MDWSDERFIKVYTRDTTNWLSLSWQARGLFVLILRKLNRAGAIDLGRMGAKGVAVHVDGSVASWPSIEPHLSELLADGCVVIEGATLMVPNFVEAQAATQSVAARKRTERERERDGVTKRDITSQNVTVCHAESHGVTRSHTASRDVTTRLEETRPDETRREGDTTARAREETVDDRPRAPTRERESIASANGPSTTPQSRTLLDDLRTATGARATLVGTLAEERGLADMLARLSPTPDEVRAMGIAFGAPASWWPQGKTPAPKHVTLRALSGFRGADGQPEWGPLAGLVAHVRAKGVAQRVRPLPRPVVDDGGVTEEDIRFGAERAAALRAKLAQGGGR